MNVCLGHCPEITMDAFDKTLMVGGNEQNLKYCPMRSTGKIMYVQKVVGSKVKEAGLCKMFRIQNMKTERTMQH